MIGLLAETSYARLLARKERPEEGHWVLEPTHGAFTDGIDLPELRDAKALLDGLA
ncbi:MAG: hypothetical protein IH999_09160 [Proteobacteria bacterium]|nr:hypothetical protein [Pseudomonadota bacterium]